MELAEEGKEGGISVERLTHEADFGLEDWEETLFFVKSDPDGAYNILDIAKYQGYNEFDEILKIIALRLASIEKILGDTYDLDRLRELVEADREGRCVVLPCKVGDTIYDISLAEIKESNVISISFIASKSTYHVSVCAENYRHAITLDIEIGDFGKTVFLTREEAEAALEEMKNG